jgi:hypothetical protein
MEVGMSYPRKAIRTEFLGPTDNLDSRVRVSDGHNRITVPWKDNLDINENHMLAAKAFREKMGWDGLWIMGWFNGTGFHVWVGDLPLIQAAKLFGDSHEKN